MLSLRTRRAGWNGHGAALALYQKSLEIREKLAAENRGNAEDQRGLSVSYSELGDVQRRSGDFGAALVLAPDFAYRTVFPLKLPATEAVIHARIRSDVPPWRSKNVFFKASAGHNPEPVLRAHGETGPIIRVLIENGGDEELRITEQDIRLEAGWE